MPLLKAVNAVELDNEEFERFFDVYSDEKILAVKYDEVDIHDTYIQTKLNGEVAYYNLKGNRVDKSTIEELKEKK